MELAGFFLDLETVHICTVILSYNNDIEEIGQYLGRNVEKIPIENGDVLYFSDNRRLEGVDSAIEFDGLASPMTGNILLLGQAGGEFRTKPRMTIERFAERTKVIIPVMEFNRPIGGLSPSSPPIVKTRLQRVTPRICLREPSGSCRTEITSAV